MINVGIIGFGYWGPNLYRNFLASPHFQVIGIAERDVQKCKHLSQLNPKLIITPFADDFMNDPKIDAIVIATPLSTHFALAKQALLKKKHVFVEKPLCQSSAEADELVALARESNRILMVDHTFLLTGPVQKIKEILIAEDFGKICYFDSMRVNLGLFQQDTNVLWDLAPHDFSIINYLLDEEPIHIEASGYSHVNPSIPDIVYLTLYYKSNTIAHLNISWMSPVKVRRIAIGGTGKMLVWDDLNPEERLKIYNSGITFQPSNEREIIIPGYRIGDVLSPRVTNKEGLENIVDHFAKVIQGKEQSIMDGQKGSIIVRMLEEAQKSLNKNFLNYEERN